MRQWFNRLLSSNRGVGPKPSGVCLWRDVDQLNVLVSDLVQAVLAKREDSWESLQRQLQQTERG